MSRATARLKAALSHSHIQSAEMYAKLTGEIEVAESNLEWPQPRFEEAKSHAVAAVILSAAALEASINELFHQAIDKNKKVLESLTEKQFVLLEQLWPEVESFSPLRKHQIALATVSKSPMDTGKEPYQSADGLFQLRNALVHFKPEWDDLLQTHLKLEKRLSPLFSGSALADRAQGEILWFPSRCFGAGCAQWATRTAKRFSDEFTNSLQISGRL